MRARSKPVPRPPGRRALKLAFAGLAGALFAPGLAYAQCERQIRAEVVALDQVVIYNRLGAHDPAGMMFALKRDVVSTDGSGTLEPGKVRLRDGLRPRPLTLRMNEGDCLQIKFTNLLAPQPVDEEQPATRTASIHAMGMQLVGSIADDGSNVGKNASSLPSPGETRTYTLYGEKEGTYLLYSAAATTGGEGDGGSIARGLFGAMNVEPRKAEWYRSQLSAADFDMATARNKDGTPRKTALGQPIINYDAVYPSGHPRAGQPILKMLHNGEIINGDLRAVITGPNKGLFPPGTYPDTVVALRNRREPFREFTIIFHDEAGLVQAFDSIFEDPRFAHTLHSGRDAFAINYGTGGIGAEILGNRFRVGPMWDCTACRYEEFFLSSWAVGDPAMPVDIPADFDGNGDGTPDVGPKATKILFPDDPSNVYASYMNDHVKFRNLHAGPKEHHVFHLHAHQWLHTPNSDNSTYLDSQAIGPGGGYTYEIAYDGSSNRNKTPGDAIFHCHFYPHFAQGMWALWRTQDVYETGTPLDANGVPVAGARALPDGEIASGVPIPGLVPLPGKPLPPMPGTLGNPGYPFFIPGIAGSRAPTPPLDVFKDPSTGEYMDGGLQRSILRGGVVTFPPLNTLDFHKEVESAEAVFLPEDGTDTEKAAMAFHARRSHKTYRIDPATLQAQADTFITNGLPQIAGAPYADPCVDDQGRVVGNRRLYKAASIQINAKYNKAGWQFPQHRMFALWDDVVPLEKGTKAPEPMFLRVNSQDCIEYRMVNLIPKEYQMDDFQVRTPTDVIGQHIHLVKFDVTSSDGSANGFNYEDGTWSPELVVERIHAVRAFNKCTGKESGDPRDGTNECPVPKAHPFFGPTGPNGEDWRGARETVQRWYADPLRNAQGIDRTLRTIFTHDHFGPSTHQQAGLYAGLITEPTGSRWRDPETGEFFGSRHDGGPTSWRADILTANPDSSYREFNFQVADFSLAYKAGADLSVKTFTDPVTGHTTPGIADPANAINPAGKFEVGLPKLLRPPVAGACPNGHPAPCPEVISADDPGTMLVNYRNEPIALRVRDPGSNTQASGAAGDLSRAFMSGITRADSRFNVQPNFYAPLTRDVGATDPFTPLMRGYEKDRMQVRVLVGAHEEGHNFSINGVNWLFEPSFNNSGFKSSQMMGISEHFEFVVPQIPVKIDGAKADHLYRPGASTDDTWNGLWGLLRTYKGTTGDLLTLPNNPDGKTKFINSGDFDRVCPKSAPLKTFAVSAVLAKNALPNGRLVYNSRPGKRSEGPLYDPTAILYVLSSDLDAQGKLKSGVPVEPMVLRVNAGDCIDVVLRNRLPAGTMPDLDGFNTLPMIVDQFNNNDVRPSSSVGLHPQGIAYDVYENDGMNVGVNRLQTADVGKEMKYRWYAGNLTIRNDSVIAVPVELGAVNLVPADPIKHSGKGLVGAMVVEPRGATWTTDPGSRLSATVTKPDGTRFREFVVVYQDDLNLRFGDGSPIPNLADSDDAEDSGQKAFNYRTEPLWFRMGFAPDTPLGDTRTFDFSNVLTNAQVGGDPQTPVFTATAGEGVRFRVLQPAGHSRNHVFQVHGHIWEELPWTNGSTEQGSNPLSEWKGSQDGHGPTNQFNVLLKHGAGGKFKVPGDYLFRDQPSFQFDGGLWGILRVAPATGSSVTSSAEPGEATVTGCVWDKATSTFTCS